MKALVYHGPGERAWDTVDDPTIVDATDAVVRIDTSTICGTDLHILKGDVPETTAGTILGHEAVGTVLRSAPTSTVPTASRPRIVPAFELAAELVRPGGRVANIGVHGKPATLHLEKLWIRDVTITTGLVDTFSIPQLLRLIASGRLDPSLFATHRFALDDTMAAYDTFADAANTNALKVVLQGAESNTPQAQRAEALLAH